MRRLIFTALAAVLAIVAVSLLGYQYLSAPTTLRIAVGPMASEDSRLVAAAVQYLNRERASIRLKMVLTEGVAASAKAVDEDKADLAIVRTDTAMPEKAQSVAVMHRDPVVFMALPDSGIERVNGLAGKTVGILRRNPANQRLLETILDHYEVPRGQVGVLVLDTPSAIVDALRRREVDAVLVVGALSGSTLTEAVAAATQASGGPPHFIPILEADAIAQRLPAFESFEIVRGAFGGSPPRPGDTVKTLNVSHRLVAQSDESDATVAELARLIFAMRPALASEVPLANRIEAPDTSASSSLPVHPGAASYYEGEVLTFFERYGDWVYLGIMVVSIVGSALAGFASTAASRSRTRQASLIHQLLELVHEARQARSEAELDVLASRADDVLDAALSRAAAGDVEDTNMAAFTLGLEQLRHAIADRRTWLLSHPIPLAAAAE